MGQVFKAHDRRVARTVALKFIHEKRLTNRDAVRRFQREAKAAARLAHPNIVTLFEAGVVGGVHFLAMEYIEGTDLGYLVSQSGPLPVPQACEYVRQAALGLQHAHERGLIHRDIKPSNLLLATQGGGVKILDMGLALMRGGNEPYPPESFSGLTQEGVVMGTADFISPEQALDAHAVDIRADIYSLGCTFYYLLSGRVPFPGGTLMQKMLKHQQSEPTPIEALRAELPPELCAVLRTMMAKRPEDRYQQPAKVVAALAFRGASAEPSLTGGSAPPPPAPSPVRSVGEPVLGTTGPFAGLAGEPGLNTEFDWLTCPDPKKLCFFMRDRVSERKLRLVACACCRQVWGLLKDPRSRRAVEAAERYADGLLGAEELIAVGERARGVPGLDYAARAAVQAATVWSRMEVSAAVLAAGLAPLAVREREVATGMIAEAQGSFCALARDILGNPFRPAPRIDPPWLAWNEGIVTRTARAVYEERAFERLPLLADALGEAGCVDEQILSHLREPGPHARGCWVLDRILGKE
jgi:hypothetical protein